MKVNFIVSADKLGEFGDLIWQIKRDFNNKINFGFDYFSDLEGWYKKQRDNFKIILEKINQEKISAVAFNSENVVIISKFFWDKCTKEKRGIIIHELGHIKYPLTRICTSLTRNNGDNLGKEFLADSYIKEICTDLMSQRFGFWFSRFNESFKIDEFKEEYDSDEFDALVLNYFNLCYFKKLVNSDLTKNPIELIQNKLLKWGLSEREIKDVYNYINEYLDSFCEWKEGNNLKSVLEEIDSRFRNKW